jgi:hypothetical protein
MDIENEEYLNSLDEVFDDIDDGYQTDSDDDSTAEEVADTENAEEDTEPAAEESEDDTGDEAVEEPESVETSEEEKSQEAEKDGAEVKAEAENPISEQKFVVKVNKETREVSYQDAPAWIQKGMDYDRVKGKLETAEQELGKSRAYMETLQLAAEQSGVTVDQLLEGVHIGILKGQGYTEAEARAELRNQRLEKQIQDLQKQKKTEAEPEPAPADTKAERAQREIEEFSRNFPDVKLTEELVGKLVPDVQKGMTLTSAYLKMERDQLKQQLAQQTAERKAAEQNKKNRAKAPASMRDSGGGRTKDLSDIFEAELFK